MLKKLLSLAIFASWIFSALASDRAAAQLSSASDLPLIKPDTIIYSQELAPRDGATSFAAFKLTTTFGVAIEGETGTEHTFISQQTSNKTKSTTLPEGDIRRSAHEWHFFARHTAHVVELAYQINSKPIFTAEDVAALVHAKNSLDRIIQASKPVTRPVRNRKRPRKLEDEA